MNMSRPRVVSHADQSAEIPGIDATGAIAYDRGLVRNRARELPTVQTRPLILLAGVAAIATVLAGQFLFQSTATSVKRTAMARSQLVQIWSASSSVRIQIDTHISARGEFPKTSKGRINDGLAEIERADGVARAELGDEQIAIRLSESGVHDALAGRRLFIMADRRQDGTIRWRCHSPDIAERYLPKKWC